MDSLKPMQTSLNLFDRLRNSKLRDVIWPIKSSELPKFVPMAMLMFTILLNQNIVRTMKDSIVVTKVGAEVISFIKLYCEMPAGLLFVIIYTKMCNIMTTEKAFRVIVGFFLTYFASFVFILYPYQEYFHPNQETVNQLILQLPALKWFFIMWSKWTFVTFYVMGELWPVIVFSILFWQLANKITKTEEAKRFYSFFCFFGQSNLLVSAVVIKYFTTSNHFMVPFFAPDLECDQIMLRSLIILVLLSGLVTLILHNQVDKKIIRNPKYYTPSKVNKKLKLGILESFKMILSSPYLGYIAIMLLGYSVAVNLIEGVWFAKAREKFSTLQGFANYQADVYLWTGCVALVFALIGSSIIRGLGWYAAAIITPLTIVIGGGLFFGFVMMQDSLEQIFSSYLPFVSALTIIVVVGALQNILGKGAKYSLFDSTKEMAYIPLDDEMKTKGKAAVDVIGLKIGKAAGAFLQMVIFMIFPSYVYNDIAGVLMIIFLIIGFMWIWSVKSLAKSYYALLKSKKS